MSVPLILLLIVVLSIKHCLYIHKQSISSAPVLFIHPICNSSLISGFRKILVQVLGISICIYNNMELLKLDLHSDLSAAIHAFTHNHITRYFQYALGLGQLFGRSPVNSCIISFIKYYIILSLRNVKAISFQPHLEKQGENNFL